MEDMWRKEGRVKPVPLDCDAILNGTFVAPPLRTAPTANQQASSDKGAERAKNEPAALLKDQKELSLKENLKLFLDRWVAYTFEHLLIGSCKRLSARVLAFPDTPLSFDKDDDDTLDFVLATANLRATAYGIPNKTRFQVKGKLLIAHAGKNTNIGCRNGR